MSEARTAWALIGQGRWAEAEAVLRDALATALPPLFGLLLRDLAQVIWMRSGDLEAALEPVDVALTAAPGDPQLRQVRALAQQYAGDLDGAAATLDEGLRRTPDDLLLLLTASNLAGERGDGGRALALATRAARVDPTLRPVQERYALACLAAGEPDQALALAERLLTGRPLDQLALAIKATACRLLGDPRAAELYDYDAFVRAYTIEVPNLPAFLDDLRGALEPLHTAAGHPYQQSLRHGTQVQSLHASADPAIRAFFAEAARIIERYQADIGRGPDPLRVRNTGQARIAGAWSVRLRPSGFHVSHIHPEGWLSSAFYVETPAQALDSPAREGWIKFGEPGAPTKPPLGPEHFVRPEPGRLVLFPSYMWHGTIPFISDERRMTIAFDAVPA